jgi:hypothetical protein
VASIGPLIVLSISPVRRTHRFIRWLAVDFEGEQGERMSQSGALLQRVQLMLRVVLPPTEPRARRPLLCKHCGQPMRIRPAAPPRPRIESIRTPAPAEGHGTV